MARPDFISLPGAAGMLSALRWGGFSGAPTVLALHGVTGNAWYFDPLAHRLGGAADLVALDLRGRGRSYEHGGPYGIRAHAADVAAVIRSLGPPVVVVGHSLGGFVALMTAADHPELVRDIVLVDSGVPLQIPDGADTEEFMERSLGPALDRLRSVWSDRVAYNTMWTQHPAFADGISIDLQRDLLADLVEVDGGFRAAVDEGAVRIDTMEILTDPAIRGLLPARRQPTVVLRAAFGLDGRMPPTIGPDAVAAMPQHVWIDLPGTNHYTALLGPTGADALAARVRIAVGL